MGCYVNPAFGTKEDWLIENGEELGFISGFETTSIKYEDIVGSGEFLPVVLVNNGFFTAAAVAYDEREWEDFINEEDPRGRIIYKVNKEKLKEVSDLENYLNRG